MSIFSFFVWPVGTFCSYFLNSQWYHDIKSSFFFYNLYNCVSKAEIQEGKLTHRNATPIVNELAVFGSLEQFYRSEQ